MKKMKIKPKKRQNTKSIKVIPVRYRKKGDVFQIKVGKDLKEIKPINPLSYIPGEKGGLEFQISPPKILESLRIASKKIKDRKLFRKIMENKGMYIKGIRSYHKGFAEFMLKRAELFAKKHNLPHIYLLTYNDRLINILEKLGYKIVAEYSTYKLYGKELK